MCDGYREPEPNDHKVLRIVAGEATNHHLIIHQDPSHHEHVQNPLIAPREPMKSTSQNMYECWSLHSSGGAQE